MPPPINCQSDSLEERRALSSPVPGLLLLPPPDPSAASGQCTERSPSPHSQTTPCFTPILPHPQALPPSAKTNFIAPKRKKKLHLCTDIKTSLTPVHIFPKLKIRASKSGCDARRALPQSRARERIVTRKVGTPEMDDCQHWAHRRAVF